MEIRAFRLDDQTHKLEPLAAQTKFPVEDASWVDLQDDGPSLVMEQLSAMGLDDPVLIEIQESPATAHVAVHEGTIILRFPALDSESGRSVLTLLIEPNRLITVHDRQLPGLIAFIRRLEQAPQSVSSLAAVVYEILDTLADEVIAQGLRIREQVDGIEQSVDADAGRFNPDETRRVRWRIVELEAMLEDQHHGLTSLQTFGHTQFEDVVTRQLSRDSQSHVEHAIRVTERLADRLSAVQTHYSLTLAERQNQKLSVLAIVSAVFLPLALITGIYGMNFHNMPELSLRYGYPIVLLVLVAIATGLLWFLRRKGWFR